MSGLCYNLGAISRSWVRFLAFCAANSLSQSRKALRYLCCSNHTAKPPMTMPMIKNKNSQIKNGKVKCQAVLSKGLSAKVAGIRFATMKATTIIAMGMSMIAAMMRLMVIRLRYSNGHVILYQF